MDHYFLDIQYLHKSIVLYCLLKKQLSIFCSKLLYEMGNYFLDIVLRMICSVCPRSLDSIYTATSHIKWVIISWTYSTLEVKWQVDTLTLYGQHRSRQDSTLNTPYMSSLIDFQQYKFTFCTVLYCTKIRTIVYLLYSLYVEIS